MLHHQLDVRPAYTCYHCDDLLIVPISHSEIERVRKIVGFRATVFFSKLSSMAIEILSDEQAFSSFQKKCQDAELLQRPTSLRSSDALDGVNDEATLM